jgi:hypothetical protein
MDHDAQEFVNTAMGAKGQVPKISYRINKPGDMKEIAIALWKKEGTTFDSRNIEAGRRLLVELAIMHGQDLTDFGATKALTKDGMEKFEFDVTAVSNAVRDGDLTVKSRVILTSFVCGHKPCPPFSSGRPDDGVQEGNFPQHTPGAGFGMMPLPSQAVSHYQLQRQALSDPSDRHEPAIARRSRHDPAIARRSRQAQGIKHDKRMVDTVTEKRRYFMASFNQHTYPFGCAKESPSRAAERVLTWELIATFYAKYLLEDIAHLDVDAAMAKTAAAMYNDDPEYKASKHMEMMQMRLARGINFEEGVKQLYAKVEEVEEVEAVNVLVITGLPEDQIYNRKKEILYCYLQTNDDFKDVIKDYRNFQYCYASMFDQCMSCQHDLDVPRATDAGRGRDTARLAAVGDGGERPPERAERPPERALKATKQEKVQALELGWGPHKRNKGFLTKRSDDVASQTEQWFTYNLFGRYPYGDTTDVKGCKFLHIDKNGKTVTRGVSTAVPPLLKCNRCSAVGKHWSHLCTTKDQGSDSGQPRGGGRGANRGGRLRRRQGWQRRSLGGEALYHQPEPR